MLIFKTFSFFSILWLLSPSGRIALSSYEKVYFVEISNFARFLITNKYVFAHIKIDRLEFSLIDINFLRPSTVRPEQLLLSKILYSFLFK